MDASNQHAQEAEATYQVYVATSNLKKAGTGKCFTCKPTKLPSELALTVVFRPF